MATGGDDGWVDVEPGGDDGWVDVEPQQSAAEPTLIERIGSGFVDAVTEGYDVRTAEGQAAYKADLDAQVAQVKTEDELDQTEASMLGFVPEEWRRKRQVMLAERGPYYAALAKQLGMAPERLAAMDMQAIQQAERESGGAGLDKMGGVVEGPDVAPRLLGSLDATERGYAAGRVGMPTDTPEIDRGVRDVTERMAKEGARVGERRGKRAAAGIIDGQYPAHPTPSQEAADIQRGRREGELRANNSRILLDEFMAREQRSPGPEELAALARAANEAARLGYEYEVDEQGVLGTAMGALDFARNGIARHQLASAREDVGGLTPDEMVGRINGTQVVKAQRARALRDLARLPPEGQRDWDQEVMASVYAARVATPFLDVMEYLGGPEGRRTGEVLEGLGYDVSHDPTMLVGFPAKTPVGRLAQRIAGWHRHAAETGSAIPLIQQGSKEWRVLQKVKDWEQLTLGETLTSQAARGQFEFARLEIPFTDIGVGLLPRQINVGLAKMGARFGEPLALRLGGLAKLSRDLFNTEIGLPAAEKATRSLDRYRRLAKSGNQVAVFNKANEYLRALEADAVRLGVPAADRIPLLAEAEMHARLADVPGLEAGERGVLQEIRDAMDSVATEEVRRDLLKGTLDTESVDAQTRAYHFHMQTDDAKRWIARSFDGATYADKADRASRAIERMMLQSPYQRRSFQTSSGIVNHLARTEGLIDDAGNVVKLPANLDLFETHPVKQYLGRMFAHIEATTAQDMLDAVKRLVATPVQTSTLPTAPLARSAHMARQTAERAMDMRGAEQAIVDRIAEMPELFMDYVQAPSEARRLSGLAQRLGKQRATAELEAADAAATLDELEPVRKALEVAGVDSRGFGDVARYLERRQKGLSSVREVVEQAQREIDAIRDVAIPLAEATMREAGMDARSAKHIERLVRDRAKTLVTESRASIRAEAKAARERLSEMAGQPIPAGAKGWKGFARKMKAELGRLTGKLAALEKADFAHEQALLGGLDDVFAAGHTLATPTGGVRRASVAEVVAGAREGTGPKPSLLEEGVHELHAKGFTGQGLADVESYLARERQVLADRRNELAAQMDHMGALGRAVEFLSGKMERAKATGFDSQASMKAAEEALDYFFARAAKKSTDAADTMRRAEEAAHATIDVADGGLAAKRTLGGMEEQAARARSAQPGLPPRPDVERVKKTTERMAQAARRDVATGDPTGNRWSNVVAEMERTRQRYQAALREADAFAKFDDMDMIITEGELAGHAVPKDAWPLIAGLIEAKKPGRIEGVAESARKFANDILEDLGGYDFKTNTWKRPNLSAGMQWIGKNLIGSPTQSWVRWGLLPRLGFHLRNLAGGLWNSLLIGVWNPVDYDLSRRMMRGQDHEFVTARGERVTVGQMRREMAGMDMLRGQAFGDTTLGALEELGKAQPFQGKGWRENVRAFTGDRGENVVSRALQTLRAVAPIPMLPTATQANNIWLAAGAWLGRTFEEFLRGAAYIAKRREGWDPRSAERFVKEAHFDYRDVTGGADRAIRSVLPLWNWTRLNTPFQLRKALEKHQAFQMVYNAREEHEGGLGWARSLLPDREREGFPVLSAAEDGELRYHQLGAWWAGADAEKANPGTWLNQAASQMNPVLKQAIQQGFDVDLSKSLDGPRRELVPLDRGGPVEFWGNAMSPRVRSALQALPFAVDIDKALGATGLVGEAPTPDSPGVPPRMGLIPGLGVAEARERRSSDLPTLAGDVVLGLKTRRLRLDIEASRTESQIRQLISQREQWMDEADMRGQTTREKNLERDLDVKVLGMERRLDKIESAEKRSRRRK